MFIGIGIGFVMTILVGIALVYFTSRGRVMCLTCDEEMSQLQAIRHVQWPADGSSMTHKEEECVKD